MCAAVQHMDIRFQSQRQVPDHLGFLHAGAREWSTARHRCLAGGLETSQGAHGGSQVVYSCFAVPYKTAFMLERILFLDPSSLGMSEVDWIIDGCASLCRVLAAWVVQAACQAERNRNGRWRAQYLLPRHAAELLVGLRHGAPTSCSYVPGGPCGGLTRGGHRRDT
jgi:hypothetical protein